MGPIESEQESSEPLESAERVPAAHRSFRRRHPLVVGLAVGLIGASIVGAVVLIAIAMRAQAPRLTRADYEAAAARWDAHGPAGYNLDLELAGNRPGYVHVEVRSGEITRMTRDGVVPRQTRTWYYWSVPGQFDTIEQEFEMAENPARSYGASGAAEVVMWAEFDPKYGYPLRFDRVVLGADLETHWKVTRFEVVQEKK